MVQSWSSWKRFPDVHNGDNIEAPIGPGVYEVRHTMTGRVMAFGHAAQVANALSELKFDNGASTFARLFGRKQATSRVTDLEYRTCAAASRAEAKAAAQRLAALRRSAWRRRIELGSVARHLG